MAEVINMPVDSLDRRSRERKDKSSADDPQSSSPPPPPPPQNISRRRDRDSRDRELDRPPNRRGVDYYDRNRSPPPRERERDYKRRNSLSPPPVPYRDRRHSPPPRRSPPYKRSRREDGGYEGRRGSPRGGFGPGDRRWVSYWLTNYLIDTEFLSSFNVYEETWCLCSIWLFTSFFWFITETWEVSCKFRVPI